jgi:hypothetical protein
MTPEELANEQDINSLTSDFNTKNTATGHQAIPLEFITGQQKNLQEQETNQMNTLQQKAALLQAKRTAAVSASKFALDRADAAVTSARSDAAAAQARADKLASDQAAASKPMAVAPGSTIIDPSTGKPIYSAPSADKTSVVNANGRQLLINTETGQTIQDLGAAPTGGQQDNSIVQTNVHQISGTDSTGKQFSTNFINLTDFPDAASKKQAMQYGADNGIPVLNPAEGEKMVAVTNAYTNIDKIASGVQNLLDKNMGWNIGKGVENTMASFLGNEDIRSFNAWRTAVINNVQALAGGAGSGLRINQAEIDTALKNDLPVISGIGADTVKSATAKLDRLKEQLDSWRGTILDKGNTAGSGGGGSGDALDKALDGIGFKKGSGGTPTATSISAAIRQTESGGNYQAKGASGEYGAYQFTPATWSGWAKQYFGDANAPMTKVNQDKVATAKVQELIDKGYNAQQIALIWNGGTPVAKKGVNSKGVAYDSGAYAKKVLSNLYG